MGNPSPNMAGIIEYQAKLRAGIVKRRKGPFNQAVELQDFLVQSATSSLDKPIALSSLIRAWKDTEYLKRDIRMKPKPKPVEVGEDSSRGRKLADKLRLTDSDPSA